MKFLLDTHCWLWLQTATKRFSADTLELLRSSEAELYLSAVDSVGSNDVAGSGMGSYRADAPVGVTFSAPDLALGGSFSGTFSSVTVPAAVGSVPGGAAAVLDGTFSGRFTYVQ